MGRFDSNEGLRVLSVVLGGSETEVVLFAVVAPSRLKLKAGFVVIGTGAGVFVAWGPILAAREGSPVVGVGVTVD